MHLATGSFGFWQDKKAENAFISYDSRHLLVSDSWYCQIQTLDLSWSLLYTVLIRITYWAQLIYLCDRARRDRTADLYKIEDDTGTEVNEGKIWSSCYSGWARYTCFCKILNNHPPRRFFKRSMPRPVHLWPNHQPRKGTNKKEITKVNRLAERGVDLGCPPFSTKNFFFDNKLQY